MANSSRNSLDSALNNHDVTDDQIHSGSEDEEEQGDPGNTSPSANGQPVRSTDRYGFLGGQQYTDPEQWVMRSDVHVADLWRLYTFAVLPTWCRSLTCVSGEDFRFV